MARVRDQGRWKGRQKAKLEAGLGGCCDGPVAAPSGCSSCLLSSPNGHSTSFQVTDLARDPQFTEFSNWRKCTEGDLVRGKTRSGMDFGFSLNHGQGKPGLSFVQGTHLGKKKSSWGHSLVAHGLGLCTLTAESIL